MEAEPIGISSIPSEIIELILEKEELSFNDVYYFSRTSKKFYQLVHVFGNKIWKAKFRQRWPELVNHQDYKRHVVSDWLQEFKERLLLGRKAMGIVAGMSPRHVKQEELSPTDFMGFEQLVTQSGHEMAIRFMIDELMNCVKHHDKHKNLTDKYYSEKVLRYLRQITAKKHWEIFKTLSPEEQILEKGAVIVAQWSQPMEEITDEFIGSELDRIAKQVLDLLLLEHGGKHPSQTVEEAVRNRWRTHNIADNHYTPYVSRQILSAASTVLFQQLGFYGNSDMYYSHDNSCINKVLEMRRGIPITLAIVFESVTRRVGIKCEPVGFPGHFLLRWRDTYKENVPAQSFYIDVFNKGEFLTRESCPKFANPQGQCPMAGRNSFKFGPANAISVVERMANNLEVAGRQRDMMNGRSARLRSALELLHLIQPTNLNCLLQLSRFYMQHNLDVKLLRRAVEQEMQFDLGDLGQASYILRTLSDYDSNYIQQNRDFTETSLRVRDGLDNVEWAVGMVMRHKRYEYSCVIVGWDRTCVASDEWITHMNVRRLSRQGNQPFYHVLVSDGTNRYAAEENLLLETDVERCFISHCEVGRFFDEFCGSFYRPNAELLRTFPDDPRVVTKLLNTLK